MKIWESRKAALSFAVIWMIKGTRSHILCRLPPDLCGQSSLAVTLLLEMGLGCFNTVLKLNIRVWNEWPEIFS
jgi:hypothetical protein